MELILLIVVAALVIVLLILSLTKGNNQTQAEQLQTALRQQMQENREELNRSIRELRLEMTQTLNQNMQQLQDVLHKNMLTNGELQRQKFDMMARQQESLIKSTEKRLDDMTFLCQQDFLNNKYEIQKESPKTQEYIKQKLGLKKQLEPTDSPVYKEMIANASKLRIAQERLRKGEIDLNTYNRIKTKLGAKFTGTVYQEMADSNSPEINAGKRYLEQLRTDNKSLIGEYTIQRIDGTNFTYQFRNNEGKKTFSVKVSFFVNEKKNVLYTISSLQKK